MPHIITTIDPRRAGAGHGHRESGFLSRQPVATLEEATLLEVLPDVDLAFIADVLCLPPQGGSVSLPDGTVIEVERVEWSAIAQREGPNGERRTDEEMLATYRETQGVTA